MIQDHAPLDYPGWSGNLWGGRRNSQGQVFGHTGGWLTHCVPAGPQSSVWGNYQGCHYGPESCKGNTGHHQGNPWRPPSSRRTWHRDHYPRTGQATLGWGGAFPESHWGTPGSQWKAFYRPCHSHSLGPSWWGGRGWGGGRGDRRSHGNRSCPRKGSLRATGPLSHHSSHLDRNNRHLQGANQPNQERMGQWVTHCSNSGSTINSHT